MPKDISKAGFLVNNRPMCKVVSYSVRTPNFENLPVEKGDYYLTEDGEMAFDSKQPYTVTDLVLKFQDSGKAKGPVSIRFDGQLQIFCYVSYNQLIFDVAPEKVYTVEMDENGCFSIPLHLVFGADIKPYFDQKKTSIMIGHMSIDNGKVCQSFSLMGELRQGLELVEDADAYAFCNETTEYLLSQDSDDWAEDTAEELIQFAPKCIIESVNFEEYALSLEDEGPNPEQCFFTKETVKAYCKGDTCAAFMLGITMKNEGIPFDQLVQWFTGTAQFANQKKTYTFNLAPTFVSPIYPDDQGRFTFFLYFLYKRIAEGTEIARLDQTDLKVTLPQIHVVNPISGEQFDLECIISDTLREKVDPQSIVLSNRQIVLKK